MIHKPIVGPSKDEWAEPQKAECEHGFPFAMTCLYCQEQWSWLALWGELLDEA